ncbi:MAG: FkbM family methyltransferase [Woeseiaceae bacterium]|nr:FkbM family methyltransferase [Woeseiaceae bacterium]
MPVPGILPRMALAAWKRFEKSDAVQHAKARLRRLIGTEPDIRPMLTLDTVTEGGWCYHPDVLGSDSVVYSLGIGDNIDFDLALIARCGAAVHAFDPTPTTYETLDAAELPPQFQFHPWAAAADDGVLTLYPRVRHNDKLSQTMYTLEPDPQSQAHGIDVPAYTVSTLMDKLGHAHVDLLKMDIEGAEYGVIDALLASPHRPTQLLVEFHHRHKTIGKQRTVDAVDKLIAAGYAVYAVSFNVREVSFMHQT